MTDNLFKCSVCKGTFVKGWTDEEAHAEFSEKFGQLVSEDTAVLVCEDCANIGDALWENSTAGMTKQ